jgi:hypothetical protein
LSEKSQEQITAEIVAQTVAATAEAAAKVLAKDEHSSQIQIAVIEAELIARKEAQIYFEENIRDGMKKLDDKMERLFDKLDRPSWLVALAMGGMGSLCVGLIVFIATGHSK